MTVFERIENLRKSQKISQGKLEAELGFSNGSISKWKKSMPTPDRLQKLAEYFGVTLEYLMTGEDTRYSDEDALMDVRISEDWELKEAIKKYYSLDVRKKKHVIELINLLSEE